MSRLGAVPSVLLQNLQRSCPYSHDRFEMVSTDIPTFLIHRVLSPCRLTEVCFVCLSLSTFPCFCSILYPPLEPYFGPIYLRGTCNASRYFITKIFTLPRRSLNCQTHSCWKGIAHSTMLAFRTVRSLVRQVPEVVNSVPILFMGGFKPRVYSTRGKEPRPIRYRQRRTRPPFIWYHIIEFQKVTFSRLHRAHIHY
jgi:hypothetical protein